MVDVVEKQETHRVAVAAGSIFMLPQTLGKIVDGTTAKGDVLGIARIAAIQGSKRTSELIPLCHPLALTRVSVEFEVDREGNSVSWHLVPLKERLGSMNATMVRSNRVTGSRDR